MTKIIAFAGRKQSGKTTCAEFVQQLFFDTTFVSPKIYNFADPLKQMCIDILGLSYSQCYGDDDNKNELVDCYWDSRQLTARDVMQIIGTDIFRKMKNNVWSDATIRKILKENAHLSLIADCRFPNEVEAVKRVGGIVIKLTRNLYNSDHDSETALDSIRYDQNNFDFIIDNANMDISSQNKLLYNFLKDKKVISL